MKTSKWRIRGEWQDSCSCAVGCPCTFDQVPTEGYCQGLLAYHVEKGNFGDLSLDDVNVVMVGKMGQGRLLIGDWVVGFIIDAKANADQREAMERIFTGKAGGYFGKLAPLIAKIVGINYEKIEWRSRGGRSWGIRVGKSTETRAALTKG